MHVDNKKVWCVLWSQNLQNFKQGARARCAGAGSAFENINRNFSGISDRPWIETFPNSAGKPREVAIVENISFLLPVKNHKAFARFWTRRNVYRATSTSGYFGPPLSHLLIKPRNIMALYLDRHVLLLEKILFNY